MMGNLPCLPCQAVTKLLPLQETIFFLMVQLFSNPRELLHTRVVGFLRSAISTLICLGGIVHRCRVGPLLQMLNII